MPILPEWDIDDPADSEDIDSPYEESIAPTRRDAEAVKRANRDPDDPVRTIELSAIFRAFGRSMLKRIRAERADTLRTVARLRDTLDGSQGTPGLVATVANHAQVVGPARTAARWAAGGAAAAVVAVLAFAYGRGAQEQHVTDEIQGLRHQVEYLQGQLDHLRNQNKDPRP